MYNRSLFGIVPANPPRTIIYPDKKLKPKNTNGKGCQNRNGK
jgi:hypothetical protein